EVSESENRPATRGTAHSEVQGDARCTTRCTARCNVRPMAALHFLPPTGHSPSGSSSFDSKLISLLPLDEAPVHVHRFAARAPCDSKGSEWAAKEKPTPISQIFLAPAAPGTPTRRHALGRLPTPPPLPENLLLGLRRKLPSAPPCEHTGGLGLRKSPNSTSPSL